MVGKAEFDTHTPANGGNGSSSYVNYQTSYKV